MIIFVIFVIFLLIPRIAFAQFPSLLPPCIYGGNCGICDIIVTVSRVFQFAFYVLGAAAFVVFFWGAFNLLLARGESQKVEKAKETLKGALWGTLFVFIAWQMINMVLFIMGTQIAKPLYDTSEGGVGEKQGKTITFKLFGNPWNYLCEPKFIPNVAPETDTDKEKAAGQRVCFSRGDGTFCSTKELGGSIAYGICLEGECRCVNTEECSEDTRQPVGGRDYQDVCDYLSQQYGPFFGERDNPYKADNSPVTLPAYDCSLKNHEKLKKDVDDWNKKVKEARKTETIEYYKLDCLSEPNMCSLENQECCGIVPIGS